MSLAVLDIYQKENPGGITFSLMKLYKIFNKRFCDSLNGL